jgi:adenylate kinase
MQIVLLGAPGSGKGTMADDLVRFFKVPHISTGEIFRQNIKDKTPLGLAASQYISGGALVPDEVTISMVAERLAQPSCAGGFMLDGFPRTVAQAEALTAILSKLNLPLTVVINLDVMVETIIERLSSRRICSVCGRGYNTDSIPPKVEGICDVCGGALIQREDDKPATIQERLATYRRETEPLISYYSKLGLLVTIDNEGEVGSSLEIVKDTINQRAAKV